MDKLFRTRFSRADGAILLSILLFAVLLFVLPWLQPDEGVCLQITTEEGSRSYPLTEELELTVVSGGHTLTVELCDGKARVRESDCPDGICVQSGWISRAGQSIICAPAGVRLLIVDQKGGDTDVDFIAG